MAKFNKRKTTMITITIIFVVGCVGVYNLIKPKEILKQNSTTSKSGMIAMYIEDDNGDYQPSTSKEFPTECYVLDHAECKNKDTVITQDPVTKSISGTFSHTDGCNLYFKKEDPKPWELEPGSLAEKLVNQANGIEITDYSLGTKGEMYTFDHAISSTDANGNTHTASQIESWTEEERRDYRYIGATPKNWIKFNEEDWRIIGVFTTEDKCGNKTQNIKIIRNESIGSIPWDDYTDGDSTNEWSTSSLQGLLNGEYYNTGNSFSYTYKAYSASDTGTIITIPKGLNEKARSQIEEVKWYLGGASSYQNLGGPDYYAFERGTTTCVTTVNCGGQTRTTEKNQRVGLMYPSDYIYTYDYGVDEKCYTDGYNCDRGTPSAGWLFNRKAQWTQSPLATNTYRAFGVFSPGSVFNINYTVSYQYGIRPAVYLKSGIKIVGGDGSNSENAYILE